MTEAVAPTTSASLTPHQVWIRVRGLLCAVLVLVAAGVALASVRSGDQHGHLDPRSADGRGSRAVAELLKDRGVAISVVTTLDEATARVGSDTTLLVASPNLLTPQQQSELRARTGHSAGRTVLLAAGPPAVGTLVPGVRAKSSGPVATRAPQCSLPAARNAGDVETGGFRYASDNSRRTIGCFPSDGLPTVLVVAQGAGDTVLLGSPDFLQNDRLGNQGNASLALQLLGSRPHLVWYLPSLADTSAAVENGVDSKDSGHDDRSFFDLIPRGWLWGTLQLALAALLAAIWRGRRLGPLVAERLPVVIRASESSEGRARLYRRVNARDRAADSLRAAARTRMSPLIGVSPRDAHSPATLVPAVSARIGTEDNDVRALLFGPAPSDDAALVHLADQLDTLEREVRTS
ncbi:DUF4350 domain-containing protein [Streptomyces sp. NPDC052052]|uniref:DUF4350 domain-containing protein n=1 Tax=Streptomyces sp. NPDC052052 TaxID=3154756 RepID=UPI003447C00C